MRFIAAVAIVVPILASIYVLSRGPRPETRAQIVAIHAADSLTRERVAALGAGDVAGWAATLRTDALVLGDDRDPAAVGRDAAVAEIGRELAAATALSGAPGPRVERLIVGATRRGRLAWTAAELEGRLLVAEPGPAWPSRQTVAYALRDDEWKAMIEHHAQAPTWEELQAGAAARRFPAPAALATLEGRGAEQLAKRFRRVLEHYGLRRPDRRAIAVGPAAGDLAAGDSAVRVMVADWERRLGEPRLVDGGLSAWAPRRSGMGWVVANLEVSPPGWGGATLPLRLTAVYRASGEDSWSLVLAHLSVAVDARGTEPTPIP